MQIEAGVQDLLDGGKVDAFIFHTEMEAVNQQDQRHYNPGKRNANPSDARVEKMLPSSTR